jgi:DNA-binding PadR family transcriptional regulator
MTASDSHRELFLLGLLRRQPLSAYAVERIMRDHVPLYHKLSRGNVYRVIERLYEAGFLVRRSVAAQRGPRQTKRVYRLTRAGERRFLDLLARILTDVQATDAALETAFVLLGQLPRDHALQLVVQRAREVENQERRLTRLFGDARKRGGAGYFAASHAYHRVRSERRYLQDVLALLRDGRWEPNWVSDDGPVTDASRKL